MHKRFLIIFRGKFLITQPVVSFFLFKKKLGDSLEESWTIQSA
jgi:hypothetical protein